jgi:uncharacterized membrane protein
MKFAKNSYIKKTSPILEWQKMTNLPPELIVLLVSMVPIAELRVGIPLGVFLGLPLESSIIWSVMGNMIPMFLIMKFLEPVSRFLMKHSKFFKHWLTKIFDHTRTKHTSTMETMGAISLITFIAIPLPGTGAWTGALICHLFNVPYWKSILYITLGVLGAALIMSFGVFSVKEIPGFIHFILNK